ncbi:MAG: efflux RND transporter periplasmic adaptor subunit [Verrucomicrobia bacterium]|nr:efflux RND transporter periplasmic adaptor subunit [Verrucomicrobiota bacterium]
MKTTTLLKRVTLATAATVVLIAAGCQKQVGHTEADGHKQGKADNAAKQANGATALVQLSGAKCGKHNAPKELCFICDPTLRDKDRLWCKEHNRYEDRCWECHPDARDKNRLYCDEHGLYEDECFLCRPELKRAGPAGPGVGGPKEAEPERRGAGRKIPSSLALQASSLFCKEHGVPEAECGICHPELAGALKPGQSVKVRLPAPDSARMAGVQTETPSVGGLSDGIECLAELAFNQNKLAQIVAPVGGIVQEVTVDLGHKVEEKQVVAKIWSAAIAEAVAKAVLTHQTLERERKLRTARVTSEKDLQQAEAEHRTACQQARTLGFTEEQIDGFGIQPSEPVLLEVRAPFAGEIVERTAVRGALVELGKPMFTLADRATMWAMLNIPEAALGRVREGQTVELQLDSIPGRTFTGKLTWVAAEVDERSRMARARAEVPNPDGILRSKMFARARILTRNADGALVVPAAAVQYVDGHSLVFVKLTGDLFEARAVRLGTKFNGRLEVLVGLKPQEEVVVAHGFPLKSQLLISRLGAGCADE